MSLTPLVPLIPTGIQDSPYDTTDSFSIAPLSPLSEAQTTQGTFIDVPAAAAASSPIGSSTSQTSSAPSLSSSFWSGFTNPIQTIGALISGNGQAGSIKGNEFEDIIFIILGLLLIAAGIFSFKSTGSVINIIAKTSKKAGELTAATGEAA